MLTPQKVLTSFWNPDPSIAEIQAIPTNPAMFQLQSPIWAQFQMILMESPLLTSWPLSCYIPNSCWRYLHKLRAHLKATTTNHKSQCLLITCQIFVVSYKTPPQKTHQNWLHNHGNIHVQKPSNISHPVVSENRATPKSSIFFDGIFHETNQPSWGDPLY